MKTAEFLLEFFTEEIPARMQGPAQWHLKLLLKKLLEEHNLQYSEDGITTYSTPRRLTAVVEGLQTQQLERSEERKGPAVNANPAAIEGFLKSTGLSLDQCEKRSIPGKGDYFFAVIKSKARPTAEILPEIINHIIAHLPWEKSMTWAGYKMRWVRPLRQILALFDGKVIPLTLEDPAITVSDTTHGHRFLAPQSFKVSNFKDYQQKLEESYVVLSYKDRQSRIRTDANSLLEKKNMQLKEDQSLLVEVGNLVEWPIALIGKIEPKFMSLPPEVLTTSMKNHQKYFSVLNADGKLAPYFIMVSNQESIDGGKQIVAGNEKVLRARLADALFFWRQDTKIPLLQWQEKLRAQIFHEQLGTVFDKTQRVKKLLPKIVELIDPKVLKYTDILADIYKADLPTGMVGEFPELQGIMGGYYAAHQGESKEVCQAIREHYQPIWPQSETPSKPLSIALALADKLDTLAGFYSVGIIPTGSKDPYALKRAATGIVRLIVDNHIAVSLTKIVNLALDLHRNDPKIAKDIIDLIKDRASEYFFYDKGIAAELLPNKSSSKIDYRVAQALPQLDNLLQMQQLAEALQVYISLEANKPTISAIQRALSILDVKADVDTHVKLDLLKIPAEKKLYEAVEKLRLELEPMLANPAPDYAQILKALHALSDPINQFFDTVIVNDDDLSLRHNRYALLGSIQALVLPIADFRVL